MTYQRILKPKFYVDTPNWKISRASWWMSGEFEKITGTFNTGSLVTDLIDMKPNNRCSFDTSADTDGHIILMWDSQTTSTADKFDFVSILNHNLDTADGRIRVMYQIDSGTTDGTTVSKLVDAGQNFTSTVTAGDTVVNTTDSTHAFVTAVDSDETLSLDTDIMVSGEVYRIFTPVSNLTSVVNGTVDSDGGSGSESVSDPAYDGSTIITFDEVTASNGRYWAIEIEDDANFSGTDLEIGLIMLGEVYTMSISPDRSVKRNISYEGVDIMQAIGGGEFANAQYLGGEDFSSHIFGQPFRRVSTGTAYRRSGGRIGYNVKFSYLDDTDIMPSNFASPWGDSVFHDVWNKTNGVMIPFIFTPDSTSTTDGDYLFARFQQNSLQMTQVANNVWDISLSLRETW